MQPERDEFPNQPMDTGTDDLPHKRSRLIGGLLVALGAMMVLVILLGDLDKEGGRIKALVALLASGGLWIGLGLLLFPWRNRTVKAFAAENNFMIGFGKLPVLWKAWLVLALVLSVGTVVMILTQT